MKDKIHNLVEEIMKIPGQKIVTLVNNPDDVFELDISEKNQFGYVPEHKLLFKVKLTSAMENGGGMIIRQFLSVRTKRKLPNGKEMWIPEKNLYGVILGSGDWIGMDIQNLRIACGSEVGTHHRNFPIK